MKSKVKISAYSKYHGSSLVHLSEFPLIWNKAKDIFYRGAARQLPQSMFPYSIRKVTRRKNFYTEIILSLKKQEVYK